MKQPGFTVIELMVSISIMLILFALAVPSFLETTQRSRLQSAAELMLDLVNQARMAALNTASPRTLVVKAHCAGYTLSVDCDCAVEGSCSTRVELGEISASPSARVLEPATGGTTLGVIPLTTSNGLAAYVNVGPLGIPWLCSGDLPGASPC